MRLKQKMALLLAGIMLAGSVCILNPVEVEAGDADNTFTLTVPGDYTIKNSGWNSIGSVGVSNVLIESGSKIKVEIENGATGRTLKKQGDESKTVGYEIKKGSTSAGDAFGAKLEFTADGTQAIGAVVSDFSGAASGTYEDTINFKATFVAAVSAENFPLTGEAAGGKVLKASELLNASYTNFVYNGTNYTAYNGYISETAGANFADAQGFVAVLNNVVLDGRKGGWTLLTNEDMAFEWWQSTAESGQYNNKTNIKYGKSSFGDVNWLWSGVDSDGYGYYWGCDFAWNNVRGDWGAAGVKSNAWYTLDKLDSESFFGFVVLRRPSDT